MVKAIQDTAVHGMSFPGPSEHEIRLAESLTTRIPGMEVVRFANSGTEATMHAVRVARAFTGWTLDPTRTVLAVEAPSAEG